MLGFPNNGYYTSPIIQSMGGMGSIPPTPIGNIANIGGYGYNTGPQPFSSYMNSPYYTNNYSYYNPYAMLQRQKAMEAARQEAIRKQSDVMKSISRNVHKALGDLNEEQMEEHLKQYDYETHNHELQELAEDVRLYNKLANLVPVQPNYAYIAYCNKISASYKEKYPDDMSLAEFLDKAGELYRDSLIEMNERKQRDGKLKYNSNGFKDLVDLHRNSSSYFNGILTGNQKSIDIGDLEIKIPDNGNKPSLVLNMPSKLTEYQQRRQQFIQACLNSGRK